MNRTTTRSNSTYDIEAELEKDHPSHPPNQCTRRHRCSYKTLLAATLILAAAGWFTFTKMPAKSAVIKEINTFASTNRPEILRPMESTYNTTRSVDTSKTKLLYHTDQPARKQFAYFFYATSNTYACAALQLIDRLTNKFQMNSSRIDVVVMHTRRVSSHLLRKMQDQLQVRTILVEPLRADATERTWRESLTKLRAFQDWGYDRVVFLDSDATPMTNLDHLFDLSSAPLYAPTAYWIEQPFFASTLLVIEPSDAVYDAIMQWARARGANAGFDMDILNAYFADSVHYLPGVYTVLNSDFRRAPSAESKLFNTTTELKENTRVVHFSCKPDGSYGKPWDWPSHDLGLLEGAGFDALFGELFTAYWRGEQALCSK